MSLLLGGPGLKLPAAGGGAMENDAAALYWFEPTGTTNTGDGTDVTAWADNTGNGNNLAQLGTEDLPTWDATNNAVDFNGSQILASAALGLTGTMIGEWDGGGDAALFIVFEPAYPTSGFVTYNHFAENNDDGDVFDCLYLDHIQDAATTTFFSGSARTGASNAINMSFLDPTTNYATTKFIYELHADQSNWEVLLDGTQLSTDTVTAANYPTDDSQRIMVGAHHASSATGGTGYLGLIHEIFATGDASSSNRSAIRSQLQTKHGL